MIKGGRQIEYNGDIVVEASTVKPRYVTLILDHRNDNIFYMRQRNLTILTSLSNELFYLCFIGYFTKCNPNDLSVRPCFLF